MQSDSRSGTQLGVGPRLVKFRNHIALPFELHGSGSFADHARELYANNERGRGGYYPVGANQMWHNGVHLTAPKNTAVRAVARGKIVAARLGPRTPEEDHEFGSPRFILMKHDISLLRNPEKRDHWDWDTRDVVFYSLYMHLSPLSNESDVPWHQSIEPFLRSGPPEQGEFARIHVAEEGPGDKRVGLNARGAPHKGKQDTWKAGPVKTLLPIGTIVELLGGRHGDWQEVRVRSLGLSSVWVNAAGNRLETIHGFREQIIDLASLQCARLDYPVEAGEIIGHVGLLDPARDEELEVPETWGLHLEIFAADDIVADDDGRTWVVLEDDTDDDVVGSLGEIIETVGEDLGVRHMGWDNSHLSSLDDAQAHFQHLPEQEKVALRRLITRNSSYWSIDWSRIRGRNPEWASDFDVDDADVDQASRYTWWRDCEAKGADLPPRSGGKALVYHYHPIAVLEYLHAYVVPTPVFFVKRGDQELVVARPADINIGAHEKVFVYEAPLPDWELGTGQPYRDGGGLSRKGSPDLHDLLMGKQKLPGIPVPRPQGAGTRIWASLYLSEGGLDAVNSYDDAFFSFGPAQQTLGTGGEKGELQGALWAVKNKAPAQYHAHFGKHGLEPAPPREVHHVDKGHVKLHGALQDSPSSKIRFKDFIWAYRGVKAMKDPEFRLPFLVNAFARLEAILKLSTTVPDPSAEGGVRTVLLKDVVRTELGQALILDAHINVPARVEGSHGLWVSAAKAVLGESLDLQLLMADSNHALDYAITAEIIRRRLHIRMDHPARRAANIVLCAKKLDEELAEKLKYAGGLDGIKADAGAGAENRMFNFLEHTP